MIDPANVPTVTPEELLARFVTQSGQFRPSDNTVKADLFIPPANLRMSVTLCLHATDAEIWEIGRAVAAGQKKTLCGRADIAAAACLAQSLQVKEDPIPKNPNHANIIGWPVPKEDRKAIALQLAAAASQLMVVPVSESLHGS